MLNYYRVWGITTLENHQNISTTPIYSSTNHGRLGLRFLIPYLDACKTCTRIHITQFGRWAPHLHWLRVTTASLPRHCKQWLVKVFIRKLHHCNLSRWILLYVMFTACRQRPVTTWPQTGFCYNLGCRPWPAMPRSCPSFVHHWTCKRGAYRPLWITKRFSFSKRNGFQPCSVEQHGREPWTKEHEEHEEHEPIWTHMNLECQI